MQPMRTMVMLGATLGATFAQGCAASQAGYGRRRASHWDGPRIAATVSPSPGRTIPHGRVATYERGRPVVRRADYRYGQPRVETSHAPAEMPGARRSPSAGEQVAKGLTIFFKVVGYIALAFLYLVAAAAGGMR